MIIDTSAKGTPWKRRVAKKKGGAKERRGKEAKGRTGKEAKGRRGKEAKGRRGKADKGRTGRLPAIVIASFFFFFFFFFFKVRKCQNLPKKYAAIPLSTRLWAKIVLQKNTLGFQSFIFFGNFRKYEDWKIQPKWFFCGTKRQSREGGSNVLGGGGAHVRQIEFWVMKSRSIRVFFAWKSWKSINFMEKTRTERDFMSHNSTSQIRDDAESSSKSVKFQSSIFFIWTRFTIDRWRSSTRLSFQFGVVIQVCVSLE